MAQKKKSTQPKPRPAEPRMYGDGKPSQSSTASTAAPAGQPAASATAQRGAQPRQGTYARIDRITDYSYVKADLRRLGITAAGILGVLIVLGIIVR